MSFSLVLNEIIMQTKNQRLITLKKIIQENYFTSQDEILKELKNQGFTITQATLSRDLKELGVGTYYHDKYGQVYYLPEDAMIAINDDDLNELFAIKSLKISHNIAVLKTKSGFANSVAAILDQKKINTIIGTVAGDDTILMIIDENVSKTDFLNSLQQHFKNILKVYKS